ncbi:MAG TPA: sugar ABC transporter permease [Acidimicrobiales bacterium]|nr:sugar ABC transporter permease [Acidimicrobiales bacterium]
MQTVQLRGSRQSVATAVTGTGGWHLGQEGRQRLVYLAFIAPAAAFVLIFFAYPLAMDIVMSLENYGFLAILHGHGIFTGLANYSSALSSSVTHRAIINTAIFTAASIICQFVIGFAMAVYFNRRFWGAETLRRLILIPWVMPLVAAGTMFQLVFTTPTGLADEALRTLGIAHNVAWFSSGALSLLVIIIANIWAGVPFNAILLYSGLQDVPGELLEAASVDGAGPWRRFLSVTVPTMRGVILIVLMLGVVYTVKAFDLVIILTDGGPANESQLLSSWAYTQAFTNFDFGHGAAVGNVLLIFCLCVGLIYLRMSRDTSGTGGLR